jgi:glycosyltransferase involved in cell wall biosynthesis
MKLLISACACAPNRGSEEGIGWNWTTEAHRLGHEVWALVDPAYRSAIESACRDDPDLDGIHWVFPAVRSWPLRPANTAKWKVRTYNLLWQRVALRHAQELHRRIAFDATHHITWGSVRDPSFLGSLGPPFILGPIGGGETSPRSLRDEFTWKNKLIERIRDLSNSTITINPLLRGGLTDAAVIFVRTPDTGRILTRAMQEKCITFVELGSHASQIGAPRDRRQTPPRLLYAGQLLYWKGVHVAIRAFAQLLPRLPTARLTIVGKGPEEGRLKADVTSYNIQGSVDFISWLPQQQLFDLFSVHDVFIFPSLHDSGGSVVMEALCRGMPVVCLDLGGPKEMVTPTSGVIVETGGRNTAEVAAVMANEIYHIFESPTKLIELSAGAISRAKEFIMAKRAKEFYDRAINFISSSKIKSKIAGPKSRTN